MKRVVQLRTGKIVNTILRDDGATLAPDEMLEASAIAQGIPYESKGEPEPAVARKVWPNSAAFLMEFMPGGDLSKVAAIQNTTNAKIAALRLLLSVWPQEVWSDDPRIQLGMAELAKVGIITEQEKESILTPIKP